MRGTAQTAERTKRAKPLQDSIFLRLGKRDLPPLLKMAFSSSETPRKVWHSAPPHSEYSMGQKRFSCSLGPCSLLHVHLATLLFSSETVMLCAGLAHQAQAGVG